MNKRNKAMSENEILNEFGIDNAEDMTHNVWYPHKKYPELVLMRNTYIGTPVYGYRLAFLSDVSLVCNPNVYDPYNIVAMMEGICKPGSFEDIYEKYMSIITDRHEKRIIPNTKGTGIATSDEPKEVISDDGLCK